MYWPTNKAMSSSRLLILFTKFLSTVRLANKLVVHFHHLPCWSACSIVTSVPGVCINVFFFFFLQMSKRKKDLGIRGIVVVEQWRMGQACR